ncbi:hypothetical protein F5X97DRAFT_49002 [Nemania serpens]|nr:hypothetical protein F5X97DRAFT_49002 [Nemania serpens]
MYPHYLRWVSTTWLTQLANCGIASRPEIVDSCHLRAFSIGQPELCALVSLTVHRTRLPAVRMPRIRRQRREYDTSFQLDRVV